MSTITREPVTHNLKILPEYFAAVRDGLKRAELRWNDREYQAGDILDLCEWDPNEEAFTGDFISVTVTHVADLGQWMPGYVLLSFAPPAPVSVPDESAVESLATDLMKRIDKITGERHSIATLSSLRVSIVEACRAAMLQNGNPPAQSDCCPAQKCISPAQDGNSPAIPDGWVACSERMPDIGTEIFYFCQDDGLRDCGIVSSSNFSDKGDAQLYVHGEGYDLRFGVDISHWMPLPASPQQEVK